MNAAINNNKSTKVQKNWNDFFISHHILYFFRFQAFLTTRCVSLKDKAKLSKIAEISMIPCGNIASNEVNNQTFAIPKLRTIQITKIFDKTIKIERKESTKPDKNTIKAIEKLFKNIFKKSWKLLSVIIFSTYSLADCINICFSDSEIGIIINKNIQKTVYKSAAII